MVIPGAGTDKVVYSLDSVMRSFLFAATITVVDKLLLKYRGNVVKDQVMNDTVAKVGCKNFAFYRFIYYETDTRPGIIVFFTKTAGNITYLTQPLARKPLKMVKDANKWEFTTDNTLKLTVKLAKNEARTVFVL